MPNYVVDASRGKLTEGLQSHLDDLATSCSYYYSALTARDIPEELAGRLVEGWQRGKVEAWLRQEERKAERNAAAVSERPRSTKHSTNGSHANTSQT